MGSEVILIYIDRPLVVGLCLLVLSYVSICVCQVVITPQIIRI